MHRTMKVTVAGVTGAIGPVLLTTLSDAGFEVQALTRRHTNASKRALPESINIVEVDYHDPSELLAVLTGQDAVISTLGDTTDAVAAQCALIEASVQAGVTRFIPSEFGSDTQDPRVRSFPFFADKLAHQDLLQRLADETDTFSYTIMITGPFLDWGLSIVPFIIDVGGRRAQIFDGGNVPFSTTRIPTLCAALVNVLHNLPSTENRTLHIHDGITTQNQLIAAVERLTAPKPSPNTKTPSTLSPSSSKKPFTRTEISTPTLEAQAWTLYQEPTSDPLSWIFAFINISIWSAEGLCAFAETDNALLGLKDLSAAQMEDVVEQEVLRALEVFEGGVEGEEGRSTEAADAKAERALEEGKRKLIGWQKEVDS